MFGIFIKLLSAYSCSHHTKYISFVSFLFVNIHETPVVHKPNIIYE